MHVEDLKTWLRKRGYPDFLIKEQVEKALRLTSRDENNSKEVNGVPLVVTYNPAFKNLVQVIRKNLQLLYADEEIKKVFSPAPFVSFRCTRNLKSYLVSLRFTLLKENLVLKSVKVNVLSVFKCLRSRCLSIVSN